MQNVPAGRESLITGKIQDRVPGDMIGMVEAPNGRRRLAQKGILLARTLVKTDSGAFPVRLYNPTGSQVKKKGTELGYFTTVSFKTRYSGI